MFGSAIYLLSSGNLSNTSSLYNISEIKFYLENQLIYKDKDRIIKYGK